MTRRWRNQFIKVTDFFVTMPFNVNVWNEYNSDHLILAIIVPFHNSPSWKLRNSRFVRKCKGSLQKLWKDNFLFGKDILCKLFETARSLGSLLGI